MRDDKGAYLPEGYSVNWGRAGAWTDVTQDVFDSEEVIEDGDFIIYKPSGR